MSVIQAKVYIWSRYDSNAGLPDTLANDTTGVARLPRLERHWDELSVSSLGLDVLPLHHEAHNICEDGERVVLYQHS